MYLYHSPGFIPPKYIYMENRHYNIRISEFTFLHELVFLITTEKILAVVVFFVIKLANI